MCIINYINININLNNVSQLSNYSVSMNNHFVECKKQISFHFVDRQHLRWQLHQKK